MDPEGFLRGHFRGYYSSVRVSSVPEISSREFGVGAFGKKIASRHLSFSSESELNSFLRDKTPFYISYSNARYGFPSARPMEKKNLIAADLVYEFDADDIQTNCKLSHDSWKCTSCEAAGKGNLRECPECGSGVKVDEWVCPECIGEALSQTRRLLALLEKDFSLSEGVSVNFSGSKGFHVHVRAKSIQGLSKQARLELLDYITATNLDLESLGFVNQKKGVFLCPKKSVARGWAKKILDGLEDALERDAARFAVMGSGDGFNLIASAAEKILKEKHNIMNAVERGFLLSIRVPGVKSDKFWRAILSSIASERSLDVDRQTSIDINKIIRVPNTIHGSTGLLAKETPLSALSSCDALSESVILPSAEAGIVNAVSPKFYVGGKWFGPFSNEETTLPLFAAAYLVARGSAFPGG